MHYLLPHTIEKSAERFPNQEAFRCLNRGVTYAELAQQTSQLANILVDLGVKRGDRVGVYLNRCLETSVAIYGIMKAGAAYVPIDPYAPPSRTAFLLKDCDIRHLVTSKAHKRLLTPILTDEKVLDSVIGVSGDFPVKTISWETVFEMPSTAPKVRILEQDLAYIMYTSGSTGAPKGIMHSHYSGLNYAKLTADLYQLTEKDRIGNHAPLHFDISTLGYFTSPLVGATSVIVPEAYTKMPASLSQLLEKEQLTVWYSVPLALVQMLQKGVLEERDISALRWVLYGGEPFPIKHLTALMKQWPQTEFSNVYGPAEVNQCTFYNFKTPPENEDSIPIGTVWGNTEMLIVDENDEETDVGELLIRTGTMMKGYWNQPELTEKSIYRRIIAPNWEERFYRTGDLVQMREDGNMLFLGRKDRQIKTRGYRVELDEVAAGLLKHEAVQEAAVYPVQGEEGKMIEAQVILKEKATEEIITETVLKNHVGQILPPYAVPQKIIFTKTFPRTSSGKIDHKKLIR